MTFLIHTHTQNQIKKVVICILFIYLFAWTNFFILNNVYLKEIYIFYKKKNIIIKKLAI